MVVIFMVCGRAGVELGFCLCFGLLFGVFIVGLFAVLVDCGGVDGLCFWFVRLV